MLVSHEMERQMDAPIRSALIHSVKKEGSRVSFRISFLLSS